MQTSLKRQKKERCFSIHHVWIKLFFEGLRVNLLYTPFPNSIQKYQQRTWFSSSTTSDLTSFKTEQRHDCESTWYATNAKLATSLTLARRWGYLCCALIVHIVSSPSELKLTARQITLDETLKWSTLQKGLSYLSNICVPSQCQGLCEWRGTLSV